MENQNHELFWSISNIADQHGALTRMYSTHCGIRYAAGKGNATPLSAASSFITAKVNIQIPVIWFLSTAAFVLLRRTNTWLKVLSEENSQFEVLFDSLPSVRLPRSAESQWCSAGQCHLCTPWCSAGRTHWSMLWPDSGTPQLEPPPSAPERRSNQWHLKTERSSP